VLFRSDRAKGIVPEVVELLYESFQEEPNAV
jgi:hypothetical protein